MDIESVFFKGYNEEYEQDENMYLVERNKFSIYDVMDKLYDQFGKRLPEFKENELSRKKKKSAGNPY